MEISFISVNVPQKNNFYSVFRVSPVSISQKQNQRTTIFLPESPILEWYIVLHFQSILFLYFWNVLKNLQEIKHKTKQTKKHYRKHREAEKHRAVSRKAAPPGSEPQWRLWEERTEHREHGSSSQNTEPQGPGGPPASHMTLSPSCAHLPSRSLFTSRNCGTTESHNSSKYSKTNTKKKEAMIIFMIQQRLVSQRAWKTQCCS